MTIAFCSMIKREQQDLHAMVQDLMKWVLYRSVMKMLFHQFVQKPTSSYCISTNHFHLISLM